MALTSATTSATEVAGPITSARTCAPKSAGTSTPGGVTTTTAVSPDLVARIGSSSRSYIVTTRIVRTVTFGGCGRGGPSPATMVGPSAAGGDSNGGSLDGGRTS
ncbi:hypothetical protein FrCorBMG51_19835 [Protofrankia coriariae]|uniref:Uncharacterized protein n=1 Tax=Protofrankia coriariae TaxID=1562887 RepID=A0ABR5F0D9_9ACTN|nr:hypothetical protein FrCorBMG51_19835 [Protofrankia coriariae]